MSSVGPLFYLIESQIIMMEVQSGSKSNWEVAFSSSRSKFEVDRPNMVDSARELRSENIWQGSGFSFRGQSSGKFNDFTLDILGELIDVELCTLDAKALGEVNAAVLTAFYIASSTSASKNQKVAEPSRLSWLKKFLVGFSSFLSDIVHRYTLKGSIITKTSSSNSSRCFVKGGFLPRYWHISQRPQMLHSNWTVFS